MHHPWFSCGDSFTRGNRGNLRVFPSGTSDSLPHLVVQVSLCWLATDPSVSLRWYGMKAAVFESRSGFADCDMGGCCNWENGCEVVYDSGDLFEPIFIYLAFDIHTSTSVGTQRT